MSLIMIGIGGTGQHALLSYCRLSMLHSMTTPMVTFMFDGHQEKPQEEEGSLSRSLNDIFRLRGWRDIVWLNPASRVPEHAKLYELAASTNVGGVASRSEKGQSLLDLVLPSENHLRTGNIEIRAGMGAKPLLGSLVWQTNSQAPFSVLEAPLKRVLHSNSNDFLQIVLFLGLTGGTGTGVIIPFLRSLCDKVKGETNSFGPNQDNALNRLQIAVIAIDDLYSGEPETGNMEHLGEVKRQERSKNVWNRINHFWTHSAQPLSHRMSVLRVERLAEKRLTYGRSDLRKVNLHASHFFAAHLAHVWCKEAQQFADPSQGIHTMRVPVAGQTNLFPLPTENNVFSFDDNSIAGKGDGKGLRDLNLSYDEMFEHYSKQIIRLNVCEWALWETVRGRTPDMDAPQDLRPRLAAALDCIWPQKYACPEHLRKTYLIANNKLHNFLPEEQDSIASHLQKIAQQTIGSWTMLVNQEWDNHLLAFVTGGAKEKMEHSKNCIKDELIEYMKPTGEYFARPIDNREAYKRLQDINTQSHRAFTLWKIWFDEIWKQMLNSRSQK